MCQTPKRACSPVAVNICLIFELTLHGNQNDLLQQTNSAWKLKRETNTNHICMGVRKRRVEFVVLRAVFQKIVSIGQVHVAAKIPAKSQQVHNHSAFNRLMEAK